MSSVGVKIIITPNEERKIFRIDKLMVLKNRKS